MSFQNNLPNPRSENPSDVIIAQRESITQIKDFLFKIKQKPYSNWNKFIILNSLVMYFSQVLNKKSQNNPLVLQFEKESASAINIWDNVRWLNTEGVEVIKYKVDYIVKILIEAIAQKDNPEILFQKNVQLKIIFPNIGSFVAPTQSIENLIFLIASNLESVLIINNSQKNISTNLYNSFLNKIEQIVLNYETNDSNYGAKTLQTSLELTFVNLIRIAEPYRSYTTPVFMQDTTGMSDEEKKEAEKKNVNIFKSFVDLQSRKSLIENKNDPNGLETFYRIQQAKGLKSINYQDNVPPWKTLCEKISNDLVNTFAPYGNSNYLLIAINNLLAKYNSQKANADSFVSIPELQRSSSGVGVIREIAFTKDSVKNYASGAVTDDASTANTLQNFKGQTLNYYDNLNRKKFVKITDFSISNRKATLENDITISSGSKFYLSNTPQGIYAEQEIDFPKTYSKNDNGILSYTAGSNVSGTIKYDLNFFENNILGNGALPNNYNYWTAYKTSELDITNLTGVTGNYNAKTSLLRDGNLFKITKSNPLELATGTGHYLSFFPPASGTYNITLNVPSSGTESWKNDIDFYILDTSKDNKTGIVKLTNWTDTTIENNFSKFSNTYRFLNTNNHKFCIHFKKESIDNNYIFNSPFISQDSVYGSKTVSGTLDFLNSLNFSNFYRSGTNSIFNFNRLPNTKLALKSAPYYTGSNKSISITGIFEGTWRGYDALILYTTGNEKKYYDIFFELLLAIFKLINNYAIARMMVPEAFDPEEIFNNDFKVRQGRESLKSFLDDLLEDSGLSFKEMVDKVQKDPRADMLKTTFPYDFPQELQWQSGKLADTFNTKQLSKIKNSLSALRKNLSKVQNLLEAIRSFVSILDSLITLGEDLTSIVLGEVINQLNKTVDSVSSLGVYFLPVWQFYQTTGGTPVEFFKELLGGDPTVVSGINLQSDFAIDYEITTDAVGNQKVDYKTYTSTFYEDLYANNKDLIAQDSVYSPPYIKQKMLGNFSPFRATTYSEFISNIQKCFYDEDDKLDPKWGLHADGKKIEYNLPSEVGWSNQWIKTGRPLWTAGNTAKVVVLAITLPAPSDFTNFRKGVISPFLLLFETIDWISNLFGSKPESISGVEYLRAIMEIPDEGPQDSWNFFSDEGEEQSLEKWGKDSAVQPGKPQGGDWKDAWNRPTLQEVLDRNQGFLQRTGEPPNFIGLTVGSIFSGPITYLKILIARLEAWNEKDDEPGLLDIFKSWINKIDTKIQKIQETILGIEKVIEFIDKLLNISFTYLVIDSNGGVDDIMAQLENASGFPNEEETQIILGCVIGYSAGGSGFDMQAYFRSVENQFKEEKDGLFEDLRIQNEEDGIAQINKFFGAKKDLLGRKL